MVTAKQKYKKTEANSKAVAYIKTLASSVTVLLFTLLMVPSISFADESEGGSIPPIDGDAETDPCDDAPVVLCRLGTPAPDTGPPNARPPTVVGNPISLVSGNKYQRERDYGISDSALEFSRNYNSARTDYSTGIGQGWSGTYSSRIVNLESGGHAITDSSGRTYTFDEPGEDQDGVTFYRSSNAANGYVSQSGNQSSWFMPDGRKLSYQGSFLVRIDYPGHQSLALFYENRKLVEVTDEAGRVLTFEYSDTQAGLAVYTAGRFKEVPGNLKRVNLPDGTKIEYDYDDNKNLARVRFDDGTTTEYHYEDEVYTNHLTGITDRLGNRYASWEYNDLGMAISSEHAGGVERVTLNYEMPDTYGGLGTTYITNSLGTVSVYRWQRIQPTGEILLLSSEGPGCASCPPANMTYSYTDDHQLASSTDASGKTRTYFYDDKGRIERIERTSLVNAVPVLEVRYEYEENGVRPVRTFKPSINSSGEYQLAIAYNADNLPVEVTESGFAPMMPSVAGQIANLYKNVSRTTRLSYEAGRISKVDGPREDVDDITRFRYDQLGRLVSMEFPSGEVLTINQYDEHGRAVEFRRAEHPPVKLQYDHYGNVSRITQLGQSVEYVYNAVNRLISITNPNGKTSTLTYDEAQRLTSVSDDLGRTVALTLDSESQEQNRTFLGVNGALINSLNYVFDAEGRIQSVTEEQTNHSSGNAVASTIEVEYDAFGQLIGARHAETGNERRFVFNELGRLLESTEQNGLSIKQEYDAHNRLVAQTDKRLNTTRYYRDDFGQVHFLVSQDTGVTQYEYDAAGNRTRKTNADGDETRYRWDAANRLVEQDDIDGKTSYLYDDSNGRLLQTSNPYITESYTYTPFAQLKTHTRRIDGHDFTTEYVYAANGKIKNKILPDGQSLRYHYYESGPENGNLRAITREGLFGLSQSTLLGEIDLDWRDGESSYLSHNGRRNETQYHADGKVSSISIADAMTLDYEYDDRGNIVGIRQNGFDQRYEYSAGQLSGANTLTGNYHYEYDVTGNRTTVSATGSNKDYNAALSYIAASKGNRLKTWLEKDTNKEIDYRYNESGSPIGIGDLKYEYNANQRPIKVMRGGNVIAEYSYNSFGERIKKVTYSQNQRKVTYFLYEKRTLVAEIDGDTLEHRQTVYLKHTPVAHLIGKSAYAVHTDNLGTPKQLTNDDGEAVWKAAHTPLGEAVIEKQDIEFSLRFPGQYADAETGTHYNYLRDYDPKTGRYLTSDPVGLEGGDNTYSYANNNLLGGMDVLGLSSQAMGLPGGVDNGSSMAEPFTLASASSPVQNPSDSIPELTELGITDPNQLVNTFQYRGSLCGSETAQADFNAGIDLVLNGYPDHLLVGIDINSVINIGRGPASQPANLAVSDALDAWERDENSSLLLIPQCADDAEVKRIVHGAVGKLVHQNEIDAIIATLGDPQPHPDHPGGCRNAGIIDVTQLHAEVLNRFQVKLSTDQRVVNAEKELILAQQRYDEFIAIHGDNPCSISQALCNEHNILHLELYDAEVAYADILMQVYDEMVAQGDMPSYNVDAAAREARNKIILGIVGLVIPLTPEDLAIEAAAIGTSAWAGKIAVMFDRFGDLLTVVRAGNRVNLDELIQEGSQAAARANTIKMERLYSSHDNLRNMDYADVVRIEDKVGAENLGKLEADFASTPGLSAAFKNDPALADAWKAIDDIGVCSFDGSTTVLTELGLKPIEALVVGSDRVLARDQRTGAQEYKKILAKYSNQYAEKVVIRSTNNVTLEQVSVVSNRIHPIFVKSSVGLLRVASEGHAYLGDQEQEQGQWVDASDLRVGDSLNNDDGTWSIINSVRIIPEEFTAYNLTIEDFNTYFVSEQGKSRAFWVHNTCINVIKKDPVALAKMNRLAANNNLGLNQDDIAELLAKPSTKGQQWDDPKQVLDALERSSNANIPGLEISHMKFPAGRDGNPNFVLDNAKKYQAEASGDAGLSFDIIAPNGSKISFDNVDASGALIDRKFGHGAAIFRREVGADGTTVVAHNTDRLNSIRSQALRQIEAAGGNAANGFTPTTPIKWEVGTELGAEGIEAFFRKEGINIEVVFVEQVVS